MLYFVAGLIILTVGAELLVRGAAALAARLGVSPLLVGLTIVAFGTSSPELAVSLKATFAGQPDIAVGNVVGSNTFNVLFILGVSALITPLAVHAKLVRIDVPIMIGASIALWLMCQDGAIGRIDGIVLVVSIITFTWASIRLSRREAPLARTGDSEAALPPRSLLWQVGLIVAGLALCVFGARWMVDGAVTIAVALGVSELIIGMTVVAAGTSMPEVATSIVAAIRGQRDIAVGNIVGSNIFNIMAILGLCGTLAPSPVEIAPAVRAFDLPVMTAVAIACLPIFFTGFRISRWEGGVFLGLYAGYIAFLVLEATDHVAVDEYRAVMLWLVIPLVALGIIGSMFAARRCNQSATDSSRQQDGEK